MHVRAVIAVPVNTIGMQPLSAECLNEGEHILLTHLHHRTEPVLKCLFNVIHLPVESADLIILAVRIIIAALTVGDHVGSKQMWNAKTK
jgi:hypothetical protein